MKKIIILIPVYNDWESLQKLLNDINENIKSFKELHFDCLVVNDASTVKQPNFVKPDFIKSLEILNMKTNKGHARCIAFGLRHVFKNKKFDNLILMDGDGEDRPVEIKDLVSKSNNFPAFSVIAKRVKRSEGFIFQFFYKMHKLLTIIFTGKNINFGHFSILTKNDVGKIYSKASLWSSFSGTVKKFLKPLNEIESERGLRYCGESKMSFFKLLIHSFSIIAVFKYQVFLRSIFMIIILYFLTPYIGDISIIFQFSIVFFNLSIFIVSLRESEKDLLKCNENLKDTKIIMH